MSSYATYPQADLASAYPESHASPQKDSASPLSQLNFLKNLSNDKKQTKDGQPPKRRGPKPDSKPALTRRQELNRQAQRTHRERKEMYIKALEQEVLRLKEMFTTSTKERDAIAEENRRLKELLASHGISYDFASVPLTFSREDSTGYGHSTGGSTVGSYNPRSESTSTNLSPPHSQGQRPLQPAPAVNNTRQPIQLPSNNFNYDQIGIDFVLTLERPCMEHMQYLLVRSHNAANQPFHHPLEPADDGDHEHMSGHALMATAPPHSHIMHKPAEPYGHKMPDGMDTGALANLLHLSNRLPMDRDGEITPVMAWMTVLSDPRLGELDMKDYEKLKSSLLDKCRCYGFGAVIEEFEVRDALLALFAEKDGAPVRGQMFAPHEVPVYG